MCIKFVLCGLWTIKEVMDMLQDSIDYDECVDYLRKWEQLGFFSSTWTSYTGWFSGNLAQYPDEYRNIAEEYVINIPYKQPNTRE